LTSVVKANQRLRGVSKEYQREGWGHRSQTLPDESSLKRESQGCLATHGTKLDRRRSTVVANLKIIPWPSGRWAIRRASSLTTDGHVPGSGMVCPNSTPLTMASPYRRRRKQAPYGNSGKLNAIWDDLFRGEHDVRRDSCQKRRGRLYQPRLRSGIPNPYPPPIPETATLGH
jgi:hypothetical protein